MEFPTDGECQRFFELIEEFDVLSESKIPSAIERLDGVEAPIIIDLLRIHYSHETEPDPELTVGTRLVDRYTIAEKLGGGGMGVVYRAKQDHVQRDVALKVIHPKLVAPKLVDRFRKEIATLGKLEHPNIVHIYDADLHGWDDRKRPGTLFFTMQLVEGIPIHQFVRDNQLPIGGILELLIKICRAVHEAHEQKVIHRDLKPDNILVSPSGEPIVLDFGLAALAGEMIGWEEQGITGFSGTPSYMAPEQYSGSGQEFGDGQSIDVYALGIIAFELLAGASPYDFPADASRAERSRIVRDVPPRRLSEFLPDAEGLGAKVEKCLRKNPADRYWTVSGFAKALSRAQQRLSEKDQLVEAVWSPEAGKVVPGTEWILERKIGEGGIGDVWVAGHPVFKEKRVFKLCVDENKVRFLKREASLFRLLKEKIGQHDHFVRLHNISLDDPPYFIAMDYVEGSNLVNWSEEQGGIANVPIETRIEIVAQAAEALQAAHDGGILHRDIKPGNLLVKGRGPGPDDVHVYVADFGIGQLLNSEELSNTRMGFTRTLFSHDTDSYAGSQRYIAPELFSAGDPTARSDIYSLGVVLYQSLVADFSKALPFDWYGDVEDLLLRQDLEQCLFGNPVRRFSSPQQLADSLRRLDSRRRRHELEEQAARSREKAAYRRGLYKAAGIAGVIVTLIGGLAIYAFTESNRAKAATDLSKLEAAAAMRSSQRSGRSFGSRELIDDVRGRNPDHSRLAPDYLDSIRLTDLVPVRHPLLDHSTRCLAIAPSFQHALLQNDRGLEVLTLPSSTWGLASPPPESDLSAAVFSPSSGELAICYQAQEKGILQFFEIASGEVVAQTATEQRIVAGVFSRNGQQFVAAHDTGSVSVWVNQELVKTFDSGRLPVEIVPSDIDLDPLGSKVAIASLDSPYLFVWDWKSDELKRIFHPGAVTALSWHPCGSHIALACSDGFAYVHEIVANGVATPLDLQPISVGDGRPLDVRFSNRGDQLLIITSSGQLRCQNWSTGDIVITEVSNIDEGRIEVSDRGDRVAVVSPSSVEMWKFDPGRAYRELKLAQTGTVQSASLAQLADSELFAIAFNHGIYFVDIAYNRLLGQIRVPGVASLAFDRHGNRLLASSMNGAHQWEFAASSGEKLSTLRPLTNLLLPDALGQMALSGDGRVAAFVHTDKILIPAEGADDLFDLVETGSRALSVELDGTGTWIAWKDLENRGFVFSRGRDGEPTSLGVVSELTFTVVDGIPSLVIADDSRVRCLNVGVVTTQPRWDWTNNGGRPSALEATETFVVVGLDDGVLVVLDVSNGRELVRLPTSGVAIASIAIDRVGGALVTVNREGRVHTWFLDRLVSDGPEAVFGWASGSESRWSQPLGSPKILQFKVANLNEKMQPILRRLVDAGSRISKNPDDPYAYYLRGRANHDLRRFNAAALDYELCAEKLDGTEPDYASSLYFHWARTAIDDPEQIWNVELAALRVSHAVKLSPLDGNILFVSAFARFYSGDYQLALSDIDRSIAIDKESFPDVKLYCRAGCLLGLGLREEAIVCLRNARAGVRREGKYMVPSFYKLVSDVESRFNRQIQSFEK